MATLKSLVDETTNIKNELKTCHTNLKNNLVEKGVDASSSDKMATLIDKVRGIERLPKYFNNVWSTNPNNLESGRIAHTVSSLGDNVYCFGGNTTASEGSGVYCFSVSNNTWSAKQDIPVKTYFASSCTVGNNIYVLGGGTSSLAKKNFCYNPSTNTWTERTGKSSNSYRGTTACVDNKIYHMGGTSNNTECYDITTDTWTSKASCITLRSYGTAQSCGNNIYFIGGNGGIKKVECYDTTTNTWTSKTDMTTGREKMASAIIDNFIYTTTIERVFSYFTDISSNSNRT